MPVAFLAGTASLIQSLRDFGDYAASQEFKRGSIRELRDYGFDLRLAFEDDRRNYEMFHAEGVPCVYIHSGYYD